jgi:hypothetical protein
MSDHTFRRLVWAGIAFFTALIWGFAFIGAKTVVSDAPRLSVWAAAEKPLPCAR